MFSHCLPFASYTVLTSILNEPTTVPDRKNVLECSTYENTWKRTNISTAMANLLC